MERKLIAQEYLAFANDKRGNLPSMHIEEVKGGIVAAALMDLLLHNIIKMEGKKITVSAELPQTFAPIWSFYEYLRSKPRTTHGVCSDYLLASNKRLNQLMTDLGEALLAEGKAEKAKGGFMGYKDVYIPETGYKEELAETLRKAAGAGEPSPHDIGLLLLLKETKILNRYFSPEEAVALKKKLKETKENPQNKQLLEMISYIDNIILLILFFGALT